MNELLLVKITAHPEWESWSWLVNNHAEVSERQENSLSKFHAATDDSVKNNRLV